MLGQPLKKRRPGWVGHDPGTRDGPRCSANACFNPATWTPVLVLSGKGMNSGKSIRTPLLLGICHGHRDNSTMEDYLDRKAWTFVSETLERAGREMPEHPRLKLEWDTLEYHQAPRDLPRPASAPADYVETIDDWEKRHPWRTS